MAKKRSNSIAFIVAYAAANLLAGGLLYIFWGAPVFREEKKERSDFALAQQRLDQSAEMIRSVPNPAKAREEIETKIEDFKKTGVSGKQLPRIIQMLSAAAAERQLKVISIRPREDIKPPQELPAGVNKVYIEMSFECPFETLGEFTRSLNELPSRFTVESIDARKKKPQSASASPESGLSVSVLLSTYMVWEM